MKMMIALIVVFHAMTSYAGEKSRTPASSAEKFTIVKYDNFALDSVSVTQGYNRTIDRIVDKDGNVCFAITSEQSTAINCIPKK